MAGPFDYDLRDLFGDLHNRYDLVRRRDALTNQFRETGIGGYRRRGDAPRLSRLMSYNDPADPQIQARFLSMLKQLGYLPRQAQ